jgi:hypothetical protein
LSAQPIAQRPATVWTRRVLEWGLVVLIVVVLLWAFERQTRLVRAQAEHVAARSTLNALRLSMTVGQHTPTGALRTPALPFNPFTVFQVVPGNFVGERTKSDPDTVPPGSWVYDADCGCVGYRLMFPEWLESGGGAIWFRMESAADGVQLVPLAEYVWMGQRIQ